MPKYEACLTSNETQNMFNRMQELGKEADVSATPTIFINNKKYLGGYEVNNLEEAIQKERNIINGKK